MEEAGWTATEAARTYAWSFSMYEKLVMELRAYWPDQKRRDIHNLHKLIADAFEGILYHDDRWLLVRDMDFSIDREWPRIEIEVRRFG
jgi:crossover junction endodeoxyribonuclease RusA